MLIYEYRVILPRHQRARARPTFQPAPHIERIQQLEAMVRANPSDQRVWFELGVLYSDAHEFKRAIHAFSQVIERNPHGWEAYLNRGVAHLNLRQFHDAERDVRSALKNGCDKAEGYRWLGEIYLAENALDLAENAFRRSLKYHPRSYPALAGLARTIEMQFRNYEGVGAKDIIPLMEKAVQIAPDNAQARAVLARMYYTYGAGEDKALRELDKSLRLDPNNVLAHLTLATIYLGRPSTPDNLQKAERAAARAVELDPFRGEPFYVIGQVFLRQGNYEDAILALRKATRLTNLPEAWHLLGQAYMRVGKIKEAVKCNQIYSQWRKFVEERDELIAKMALDPHNVDYRYRFAVLMMERGSPRAALSWLKSIVRRQPDHLPAHEMMLKIYRQLDEPSAARRTEKIVADLRRKRNKER
ncbi:MAG: tetratricopeptide repeat protein [Abditibacteriales bacterium]|nr:tetratricopeptide repeat protein [Abditibacteriales bacterium]